MILHQTKTLRKWINFDWLLKDLRLVLKLVEFRFLRKFFEVVEEFQLSGLFLAKSIGIRLVSKAIAKVFSLL